MADIDAGISAWTKSEVAKLLQQAEEFLDESAPYSGSTTLSYITKDKDLSFYTNIFENNEGILKKYTKDRYGNPQCPLSGRLDGLFFSARVQLSTGLPFPNSPFGSRRLTLPVDHLVTEDRNLYFCDFYCMHRRPSSRTVRHHITLALCEPGSSSDVFCSSVLPALDIYNNKFMSIRPDYTIQVAIGAYVEIFYTESIDISDFRDSMFDVQGLVPGRDENPRKNKACKFCNLDPIPAADENLQILLSKSYTDAHTTFS